MKTIKIPSTYFTGRLLLVGLASLAAPLLADQKLAFEQTIQPLLKQFCLDCHSTKKQKGDLDLERFTSLDLVKRDPVVWEHSLDQIRDKEMPPKGKPKPSPEQTKLLTDWMQGTLDDIALASAGDPGPVVLRRLSNMEYTYSIRDLTGVESLDPAKEFPVDGAAGEGFTNAGAALVMSPALLTKYLDAAKDVASHAVLTPTGIQFSAGTSSRDWTDETLARIREFYAEFSDTTEQSVAVNGAEKVSNKGGRLPIEKYLAATLQERSALASGSKKIADVARERRLSAKYLGLLWAMLQDNKPSALLDPLRAKWREGSLAVADIEAWQQALWRFTNIGHLGKVGGPKSWMEPVTPLAAQHELRMELQPPSDGGDLTLYLATSDAGDGNENDFALWEKARLITPGHGELLLRDVRSVVQQMMRHRDAVTESVVRCLAAANEAASADGRPDLLALAQKHNVDGKVLAGWLNYLGIGTAGEVKLEPLLVKKSERSPAYEFIKGWTGDNALSVLANSSDATVKIPGTMPPHSVATHPSPKLASVIAWRSPVTGTLRVSGNVQDGHTVGGNGITYALELRRGQTREVLAAGESKGSTVIPMGPFQNVRVMTGDVIALVIDPRDGDHSCDHTTVNLTLNDGKTEWDLAKDVSPDILAGNPHADRHGNKAVWHFLSQPAAGAASSVIPSDSLLSKWRKAKDADERARIAAQVQQSLQQDAAAAKASPADRELRNKLLSFNGPLLADAWRSVKAQVGDGPASPYGLDPAMFGKHPKGDEVAATSLCVHAPSVIELRLPASLLAGAELVTTGRLNPTSGGEGSVQMRALTTKPAASSGLQATAASSAKEGGAWNSSKPPVIFDSPILVQDGSAARQRLERAFDDFRALFPAALCYTKIVPADEVVTLTLFHREDEQLRRLILDDAQSATLDRLWDELHFVSQDALTLVDAFEQIWQFSSQDGPDAPNGDKRLEPMREPIMRGAEAFKKLQIEVEPKQVQAVLDFATQAWRRPLRDAEQKELHTLYQTLRTQEMPHVKAVRMMLARVLVAPAFLYRGEKAAPGPKATPVTDWEIATRLSYFLWSSAPDAELRSAKLEDIPSQAQRMLKSDKVRRLALEFGCQYLHVRDVATLDEKSERHFPTFLDLRDDMQEEVTRFFIDLIQNNRSIVSLLDADHTFVNEALVKHYQLGFPTDSDSKNNLRENPNWHRIDGLHDQGRGGILGFAATLSKQAGASRTSAILRGTWLTEVVLGEKLPPPPKGVPILPEEAPDNLTERQLIERHSSDANCAGCHKRIDPYGFALEGFDAIGRARQADTQTTLPDGTAVDGLNDLRDYLLTQRRDDFTRQFCRKLLGYALGRSVQLSDKPLIEQMMTTDLRFGSLVDLIVRSSQFRELRGRGYQID
jgi:hypothetical protein